MKNFYEILDWDSNFFQFVVCRIKEIPLLQKNIDQLLIDLANDEVELAYYASKDEVNFNESILNNFEIQQVDIKTTYNKFLDEPGLDHENIQSYPADFPNEQLIKLAVESGIYSRFNIDPKIDHKKFEDLYRLWIINSVNKEIANEVLVYYEETEIAGFITLGEKNNQADIGIIAVDANYRGKGIAKALIAAAENWFVKNGYHRIQVVTQGDNKPACALYEKCGYCVGEKEVFYHLWRKKRV